MSEYQKPLPHVDWLSAPYWDYCRKHDFRLQKCSSCGTVRYPPKEMCPNCLSREATWEPMSGKGKVWSWVEMHQPYFAGFREDLPYIVLFVQLAEGPMIMANLVDSDREQLQCEAPVEVTFVDVTPEVSLPQFRLVGR
jgi:uncharacterized OB-fold protein